MDKRVLIGIYKDTVEKSTVGKYSRLKTKASRLYVGDKVTPLKKFEKTNISVVNQDTLVTCQQYVLSHDKDDKNVCALNMASYFCPGGGVERGSTAQEEGLFRRTNYVITLKKHFYPMKRPFVVYSPNVWIIKDENYDDLSTPFEVAFIAAAALKYPETHNGKYANQSDFDIMFRTIENVFKCAYANGHTTLVLGALGCGAYGNPQGPIIDIFNILLERYYGCFKNIVFAVYSRRDNNFDLFDKHIKREFEKVKN